MSIIALPRGQVQALVVRPLTRQPTATQVSMVIEASSHETRFAVVQSDPTAGWTAVSCPPTARWAARGDSVMMYLHLLRMRL